MPKARLPSDEDVRRMEYDDLCDDIGNILSGINWEVVDEEGKSRTAGHKFIKIMHLLGVSMKPGLGETLQ